MARRQAPHSVLEVATCYCSPGHCDCIDARVRAAELQATFNLRWDADMRAIKRWQAATGRELVWPDHADLVVWLLEQLEHNLAGPAVADDPRQSPEHGRLSRPLGEAGPDGA